MHCFPVGAALQDDGNLPSGVFLGGSLPPQLAELALATKASAIAQAITSGRIPPRTRRKLQAAEDGRRSRSRRACSVMTPHIGPRPRGITTGSRRLRHCMEALEVVTDVLE